MDKHDLPTHDQGGETESEMEWICAATAPNQLEAEMWQQSMREEGIPSRLAPHDTMSFLGLTSIPVRLMVPAEMEERVRPLLDSLRSNDALLPDENEG